MLSNEKMTYILQDERVQDFYIKKILESFSSAHTPIFFKNIIEEWMENTKPLLKASTYIKYRNMLYSYIFPYFEDLTTEELTVECLNSFCRELLCNGGKNKQGLSSKTVSDVLSLLRSIVRYASTKGISLPCTGKEIIIKKTSHELRVFSIREQKQLCKYLCKNMSLKNIGILICLYTGLRVGEICALHWNDISLKEKTLYIHQTLQRLQNENINGKKTSLILSTPKSSCSIRTIPLPDDIAVVLDNFPCKKEGYLLTGTDSCIEPRTMQNHFKHVLKEATIEETNFHTLRHTFATRCVEAGFDIKSLSEILGHSNVNITMNRYVHPTLELKRQNMQRLSCSFASAFVE